MSFDLLEFATVLVAGFTSCAEFGSYAFVHPVIRNLPPKHHVEVEQGLLKTFGRVMPALMTLCPILSLSYAIQNSAGSAGSAFRWCSAAAFTAALICTVIFNVPINLATRSWQSENRPSNWKQIRTRWEFFQGVRSWLLLIGFLLICLAVASRT